MPKNKYAEKLKAAQVADRHLIQRITRQMTADFAHVALGRMGWGEKRQKEFAAMLNKVMSEYVELMNADVKDDPNFIYGKACLDRELEQYCGVNFQPWEVRYG